ncbi:hypothetical protein [Flavobacterium sp.]|uniref:hypothetical protein n=1 Tax=Flavobacterium sp. TaxID=239 RepID=UPI0040486A5A
MTYCKLNSDTLDMKITNYLVKQFYILETIEKKYLKKENPSFKSNISEVELIAYKILENKENIKESYNANPSDLLRKKSGAIIYVDGLLMRNYEIFAKVVNEATNKKELIAEFKNNNLICREKILQLLR